VKSKKASKKKASKKKASKKKAKETTAAPGTPDNPFVFRSGIKLTMREGLTEEDEQRVPKHDPHWEMSEQEVKKWEAYAIAVQTGENVLDVGPTGCGKSDGVFQFAATLNQPVIRFNLSGDARVAEFIGEKVVDVEEATKQSVVVWRDGVLPMAMKKGWWLILDELDSCPPQILFALHAVLEGKPLILAGKGGESIGPAKGFNVFASANTLGRGDDTGLYEGTNVLNEAFLDRFGLVLNSSYPSTSTEVSIITAKSKVKKADAKKMQQVAAKVREALASEECECTFSTRRLIKWAQKSQYMDIREAANVSVLNKLNRDDKRFVGDLVQRYFGGEVE
jgi:cobaltochelatase CobS